MSELRVTERRDSEPPAPLAAIREAGYLTDYREFEVRAGTWSYLAVRSRDNIGIDIPDWRWHISVSGKDDVPAWRDLVAIAHAIRPGVPFVVGVPPRSQWMSVHPHCLHLMETKDENLLAQWRFESLGSVPS